jgi:signal transduction histidine kinase
MSRADPRNLRDCGQVEASAHKMAMDSGGSMPRIHAPGTCDRNTQINKNGAIEIAEHRQMSSRGPEALRTAKNNVLEFEGATVNQTLVPFISHDIRHHLATIYCNLEFMNDQGICQIDREQLLAEVRGTIQDITDLLDSFLLSVRTQKTLHVQSNSINLLVQRAVNMVRLHPDARGCEVVTCDAPSILARIDSQRLGSAVYNLLLNACQALKHCSPPRRVEIALCHDEGFINIRVEDNGQGISDSIRDLLFQPFVSAEKMSGVGLGLPIAEQAAREHGGRLYLEQSRPGRTVFVMHFPRLALEAQIAGESSKDLEVCRSITSSGALQGLGGLTSKNVADARKE